METNKKLNFFKNMLTVLVFICYIAFFLIDFVFKKYRDYSDNIKYFSIIFCFVISLLIYFKNINLARKSNNFLPFAMLFTVFADLFLLFDSLLPITQPYVFGLIAFCVAHLFHKKSMGAKIEYYALISIIITVLSLTLMIFKHDNITLVLLLLLYAVLIFTNTATSFKTRNNKKIIGFLLFICCDICVLIYQISLLADALPLNSEQKGLIVGLSWVFYLPSQFLLATSEEKI